MNVNILFIKADKGKDLRQFMKRLIARVFKGVNIYTKKPRISEADIVN
jgi:hypothetical protein